MVQSEKAIRAMLLGADLAMGVYEAARSGHEDRVKKMRERIEALELKKPPEVPDVFEDLRDASDEIFNVLYQAFKDERVILGGDVYCLPFFVMNFTLFRSVSRLALGLESEDHLFMLGKALEDLGVDAEESGVGALIRAETDWIRRYEDADDIKVEWSDIVRSWGRIGNRIMQIWQEAERRRASSLPAPGVQWVPTYSAFISYSSHDEEFATALFEALQLRGLRVWYAPDDVRAGQKLTSQLTGGIENHDKLLLILSDQSIQSPWVQYEIRTSLERARQSGSDLLVPIRLMSMEKIEGWSCVDSETGVDLAAEVKAYFIPDFTGWRNPNVFEEKVGQLVESLRRLEKEEVSETKVSP